MEPWLAAAGATTLACAGTAWAGWRWAHPLPRSLLVLRYDLVGPPRPGSPLNDHRLPLGVFQAHLRHLSRRGFRPVTLREAWEGRRSARFLASNPVALTFDGPWATFHSVVLPQLKLHGMLPATLFFPAGWLGHEEQRFAKGRPEPLLGVELLRLLAEEGVHVELQSAEALSGTATQVAERWRSEAAGLSQVTGRPVEWLALPPRGDAEGFGRAARRAGFRGGVLASGHGLLRGGAGPFGISRLSLRPGSQPIQLAFALARRLD